MKIKAALDQLKSQLPLEARQEKLAPADREIHKQILWSLVRIGRPPSREELVELLGNEEVEASLHRLASSDLVVLDVSGAKPVGAYPITLETTPHKIKVNSRTLFAMCALDAVTVAPLFEMDVQIDSVCRVSKIPIHIQMKGSEVLQVSPADDVMVGIRWQMPVGVAAYTMCQEMVFLKNREWAETWQAADQSNSSLFSILEAVEIGVRFFQPLLK